MCRLECGLNGVHDSGNKTLELGNFNRFFCVYIQRSTIKRGEYNKKMSDNGWKESYLEQVGQKRQDQEDAQAQIDRFTKKHNEYYCNELREELVQDETT